MFWRRSDREKIEGPAELVLPVREEPDEHDLVQAPGQVIAIEWHGPFGREKDKSEDELAGKPLVYVITDIPAAESEPIDVVERAGFSKAGNIGYIKERLTAGATARAWIGVVRNLAELTLPPSETFAPGDPDARDESEFDAHLALARRAFSYLLRPRLAGILTSPEPLPPPAQIRNLWSTKRAGKHAFSSYCPDTIRFFENQRVRLAWDDQARFFAWTGRTRAQHRLAADVTDRHEPEPQRPISWALLRGLLAVAAILALIGWALSRAPLSLPRWFEAEKPSPEQAEPSAGIARLQQLLDAANRKIAALQAELRKTAAHARELEGQLSLALARITQLEQENQALKQGGAGIELQSCWSREGQRILPVYRIAIQDGGFRVEPSWKASEGGWPMPFADKMEAIRPIESARTVAPADFAAAMAPYYALGQKTNCRFFVDVSDQTTSKESWKSGLAMVERYFYKRLVP